jgi:protein gp37
MTASKIEWTGRSDWNPIRGCTRVSEGCGSARGGGCYAEVLAARFSFPAKDGKPAGWGHGFAHMVDLADGGRDHRWTGHVELMQDRLYLPLRWRTPGFVFPSSTSDIFHEKLSDAEIDSIFAVMALTPHLTYQLLTKRMARAREYLTVRNGMGNAHICKAINDIPARLGNRHGALEMPLPNVWIGTSVEDDRAANERLPDLVETPAALRWVSFEPLIGPVDATRWLKPRWPSCGCGIGPWDAEVVHDRNLTARCPRCNYALGGDPRSPIGWAVVGGESGPGARDNGFRDNARALLAQCGAADVPFFGKQDYKKGELPADLQVREMPEC